MGKKIGGASYYKKYLKGKWWVNLRSIILKRDNFTCQSCGSKKNLQVHHKKYRGFYKEKLKDLITLCKYCHWYQHSFLRKIHIVLETILYLLIMGIGVFYKIS